MKSLSELPAYPADFVRRRLITFVGIVLGYSCFYLTRNSLTYTAPVMVSEWERAVASWHSCLQRGVARHAAHSSFASMNGGMSGTRLAIVLSVAPVASICCLQVAHCWAALLGDASQAVQCAQCCLSPLPQVADPSLPIGMTEIGTMTSIFPIAYGFRCGRCSALMPAVACGLAVCGVSMLSGT